MALRIAFAAAATAALLAFAPAHAAPPAGLDAEVQGLMKAYGVPGMGVSIVENGEVTHARGYGVRKLGAPGKVDEHTIFMVGSTGKAFTTAAIATLVDEGKLGWDDRVVDHMPWFQMYDPWVTREMTVRDLLVHRSGLGLGEGDLLFVPRSSLSRKETVKRLRHLKPATSFRSGFAYDNVLYMVAGQLIEEVTGQTWEAYVRDHVLEPAGMADSTSDDDERWKVPDRAWPHARLSGAFRGLGPQEVLDEKDVLGRNAAPAGGVAVSPVDMARWLQIQLGHGALPGGKGRLFSEASSAEMWKPVVPIPVQAYPGPLAKASPEFESYALGWFVRDYQGHKIITHDGADLGFRAVVVLIPEKKVGFAIQSNAEDGVPLVAVMYDLLDHYLGLPDTDWPAAWGAFKTKQLAAAQAALKATVAQPAKAGPSMPLERYAGNYADPWYGPISIRAHGGKLVLDMTGTPGLTGELEHFQYDTFRTRWNDRTMEPAYVTFGIDADGKVDRITMKAASPLADFSYDFQDLLFTPVPAKP
jgi:CubicO group peptidase (beta-lactamase class C family)